MYREKMNYKSIGIEEHLHIGMKLEALSARSNAERTVQQGDSEVPRAKRLHRHQRPHGHQTQGELDYGIQL